MNNEEIDKLIDARSAAMTENSRMLTEAKAGDQIWPMSIAGGIQTMNLLLAEIAKRMGGSTVVWTGAPEVEMLLAWRAVCPYCKEPEIIFEEPPERFRNDCRRCGKNYLSEWKRKP